MGLYIEALGREPFDEIEAKWVEEFPPKFKPGQRVSISNRSPSAAPDFEIKGLMWSPVFWCWCYYREDENVYIAQSDLTEVAE